MRKGVAYLFRYREVSLAANAGNLQAQADVDDPTDAIATLDRITTRKFVLSPRGFEDLGINLTKEIGMKPPDCGCGILLIDNKAEIDVGCAVRNHEDVDLRQAAERTPRHTGRVLEIITDEAYQRGLGCDLDITERPKIFQNGIKRRKTIERKGNGDFGGGNHVDRRPMTIEDFEKRSEEAMSHEHP